MLTSVSLLVIRCNCATLIRVNKVSFFFNYVVKKSTSTYNIYTGVTNRPYHLSFHFVIIVCLKYECDFFLFDK